MTQGNFKPRKSSLESLAYVLLVCCSCSFKDLLATTFLVLIVFLFSISLYYKIVILHHSLCEYQNFCSAGFAFATTSTACSLCTGGKYQNQDAAVSVSCLTCGAGTFSPAKETACGNCDTGKYQELAAAIEYQCKFCVAGRRFNTKVASTKITT